MQTLRRCRKTARRRNLQLDRNCPTDHSPLRTVDPAITCTRTNLKQTRGRASRKSAFGLEGRGFAANLLMVFPCRSQGDPFIWAQETLVHRFPDEQNPQCPA